MTITMTKKYKVRATYSNGGEKVAVVSANSAFDAIERWRIANDVSGVDGVSAELVPIRKYIVREEREYVVDATSEEEARAVVDEMEPEGERLKLEAELVVSYTVKRQPNSSQWGVYRGMTLIEGGFFDRDAAVACAANWNTET